MTHDELLAEIDRYLVPTLAESEIGNKAIGVLKALRAVVELHSGNGVGNRCVSCSHGNPCETIQAIEKELK